MHNDSAEAVDESLLRLYVKDFLFAIGIFCEADFWRWHYIRPVFFGAKYAKEVSWLHSNLACRGFVAVYCCNRDISCTRRIRKYSAVLFACIIFDKLYHAGIAC